MSRDFDLIVYGATGFTGRLVAEYLNTQYAGSDIKSVSYTHLTLPTILLV